MPKSTKHKKARVADFSKAKLKLGKGKVIQQNATNTDIASKSIALPAQSLGEQKDVPTSKRNLTLADLLVQSRHYSTSVKKEALSELQQLLISYPYLLQQHLLPLISSISHLISDPIPSLRTATLSLLTYIFSVLPQSTLESSTQGLILFTISALSSLDEGVRIDALKVLDLLLDQVPLAIVQGWDYSSSANSNTANLMSNGGNTAGDAEGAMGDKVVEALLSIMRVRSAGLAVGQGGYTSASSADLSPSSRLAILTTLSSFLRAALSPTDAVDLDSDDSQSNPWYLSTSFANPRQYSEFVEGFTSTPSQPRSASCLNSSTYTDAEYVEEFSLAFESNGNAELGLDTLEIPFASTSTSAPEVSSSISHSSTLPTSLLSLLHPTLLSSFLDSAPSAFSPTPDSNSDSHLTTIAAVIAVSRELFWAELGGVGETVAVEREKEKEKEKERARKLLVTMLNHVAVYFPFGGDELEERSKEAEIKLLELNLTFTSLVSLLVLATPETSSSSAKRSKGKQTESKQRAGLEMKRKVVAMVDNVCEWVIAALKGEIVSNAYPMGQVLTPEAYVALEPTIWALLNQQRAPTTSSTTESSPIDRVLVAVLQHFAKTGSGSECKKKAFEFIARIVLIQVTPGYSNRFSPDATTADSPIGKWMLSLTKYLWELGGKASDTSDLVLEFLGRIIRQGSKGLFDDTTLAAIIPSLVPFFHLSHPTRGSFPGPFNKLPSATQKKALDLVEYLSVIGQGLESTKSLITAVGKTRLETDSP